MISVVAVRSLVTWLKLTNKRDDQLIDFNKAVLSKEGNYAQLSCSSYCCLMNLSLFSHLGRALVQGLQQ